MRQKKLGLSQTEPPSQKESYKLLGDLLAYNFSLIPQFDIVDKDNFFSEEPKTNERDKKVGMTVGRIISAKDGTNFLLKKSGRIQELNPKSGLINKTSSRNLDLKKGARESFNEKCASVLFSILKQEANYLPKFLLVRSGFNISKMYNVLKDGTGVYKVYIASEIIGDATKINDETKGTDNYRLLDPKENRDQDLLLKLKTDLCENAIIMFLLSNYDIKLDNFVNSGERLIPIDFGNARYEEKSSPDVVDGIDMMRRVKKKSVSNFGSKSLKKRFNKDSGSTQVFYNKILEVDHFLSAIHKIKDNQENLEDELRKNAFIYTFGTHNEKEDYANIIVTRLRNLLKLEPMLLSWKQKNPTQDTFAGANLRDIVSGSDEFKKELLEADSSKGKEFFRFFENLFKSIEEAEKQIITSLEEYQKLTDPELVLRKATEIHLRVDEFNDFLVKKHQDMQEQFFELEKYYLESEYLSGENNLADEDNWKDDKEHITQKLQEIFETMEMPLIENDEEKMMYFESELLSAEDISFSNYKNDKFSESNDSDNRYSLPSSSEVTNKQQSHLNSKESAEQNYKDFSTRNSEIEVQDKSQEIRAISPLQKKEYKWDLTKSEEYLKKLNDLEKYTSEEYKDIKRNILSLMTHLCAHDTLIEVRLESQLRKTASLPNSMPESPRAEKMSASEVEKGEGKRV